MKGYYYFNAALTVAITVNLESKGDENKPNKIECQWY